MSETTEDRLRIFLSHKAKDGIVAKTMKEELEKYGPNRLELFLSEGIPFGENWSETIHQELDQSDWLFLLYTEPSASWDWCLYEVGFFAAKDTKRLICLFPEGAEVPGPLQQWQSVQATKADWVKLLQQVFGEPPRPDVQPINPNIASNAEELGEIADTIIQAIGRKPSIQYFSDSLTLVLDSEQVESVLETGIIPADAPVEARGDALDLFGLHPKPDAPWRWGELVQELRGPEQVGWTQSLGVAAKNALAFRRLDPFLPVFASPHDGRTCAPVLDHMRFLSGGKVRLKVDLVEKQPASQYTPTGDLGTVTTLVRSAIDFRWGVIGRFTSEISRLRELEADKEEMLSATEDLARSIRRVESQSAQGGLYDPDTLSNAFPGSYDGDNIVDSLHEWRELKTELSAKIEAHDILQIVDLLEQLRVMNMQILLIGAERLLECLKETG